MEMLENITSVQALVVVLGLHLVLRVVNFAYDHLKKKSELSETAVKALTEAVSDNTEAVRSLKGDLEKLEEKVADVTRLRRDLRRYYFALKLLAGERWPEISKEITNDLIDQE